MEVPKKISIVPGRWNEVTENLISLALTDATLDDIKAQTDNGARLFVVQDEDAETLCAFVLRVDHQADKSVGVVVAAGGFGGEVDLTASILPVIETMFVNCAAIRIHTARPGMVKKLARIGYGVQEIVLTKGLQNGQ